MAGWQMHVFNWAMAKDPSVNAEAKALRAMVPMT